MTDLLPLGISSIICLLPLLLAIRRPRAARFLLAFMLITGGLVNMTMAVAAPSVYAGFGDSMLLPVYVDLLDAAASLSLAAAVFLVGVWQMTFGLLALHRGRWAKTGLVGGVVFFLAIVPLGLVVVPSVLLAATAAFLLRRDPGTSLLDLARDESPGPPAPR